MQSLRAGPIAYGQGLAGRIRAVARGGVDAALDAAGNGVLAELMELVSGARRPSRA